MRYDTLQDNEIGGKPCDTCSNEVMPPGEGFYIINYQLYE